MTQFDRLFRAVEPTVLCYPANRSKKEANENKICLSLENLNELLIRLNTVSRGDQEMVLARLRVDTPLELVYLLCQ